MLLATILFWLGRNQFVHIPASGWEKFRTETFGKEGFTGVVESVPYCIMSFFPFSGLSFDQTGSSWVLQGVNMNQDLMTPWGKY